ncbi:MAG: hypothetical protein ACJ8AW_09205 [Rhodopila sp.]
MRRCADALLRHGDADQHDGGRHAAGGAGLQIEIEAVAVVTA